MNNILMERNKRVEGIIKRLVYRAFDFASSDRSVEEFEDLWINSVAKDTGLSREIVMSFHHPVWWDLTLSEDSVLEFYQPNGKSEVTDQRCIRLRKPDYFTTIDIINDISKDIYRKYKDWYDARARSLLPKD